MVQVPEFSILGRKVKVTVVHNEHRKRRDIILRSISDQKVKYQCYLITKRGQ